MKYIKRLIPLLFLFNSLFVLSQDQKITKKGYEKSVDFANCMYVEFSITDTQERKVFKEKCDCDTIPEFSSIQDAIKKTDDKTLEFAREFNKLKQENTELTQQGISKLLSIDVFDENYKDGYKEIYAYGNKDTRKNDPKFRDLKSDIGDGIMTLLNEHLEKTSQDIVVMDVESKKTATNNNFQETNKRVESGWFDGVTFQIDIISIIISILFSMILFVFLVRKNFNEMVDERLIRNKRLSRSSSSVSKETQELFKQNNRIDSLEKEYRNLRGDIDILKNDINKTEDLAHKKNVNFEYRDLSSRQTIENNETNQNIKRSFYLSTPNKDGSFNNSSIKASFIQGTSIYKFTELDNPGEAEFVIDSNEKAVRLALDYPDKNIDPCCEVLNAYTSNVKSINTVEPGIAKLNDNLWVIIHKAKISYVS